MNGNNSNLGFLRNYLATTGVQNKEYLSDIRYVLANPRFSRFFSSETPKKKSKYLIIFWGKSNAHYSYSLSSSRFDFYCLIE